MNPTHDENRQTIDKLIIRNFNLAISLKLISYPQILKVSLDPIFFGHVVAVQHSQAQTQHALRQIDWPEERNTVLGQRREMPLMSAEILQHDIELSREFEDKLEKGMRDIQFWFARPGFRECWTCPD